MKDNAVPLALLLMPGIRGMAYLSEFTKRGVKPEEIIVLDHDDTTLNAVLSTVRAEGSRHGYTQRYYDLDVNVQRYLEEYTGTIQRVPTRSINDPLTQAALTRCRSSSILFAAAGIATAATLNAGPAFLHIHSGLTPRYRGSTCFYYSLLESKNVGTTAFFMSPQIDRGAVILQQEFAVNCRIAADQPHFLDHILDPYIRAVTLGFLLDHVIAGNSLQGTPQSGNSDDADYYVAHPLLRRLAIDAVNKLFDSSKPEGITVRKTFLR